MSNTLPAAGVSDHDEESELKAMYKELRAHQTTKDTRLATLFYRNLRATRPPEKWTCLIRYPRIGGKRVEPGKDYSGVCSWEPGHELHTDGKEVVWACLGVDVKDDFTFYTHHSIVVYPNGKLIGVTSSNPRGKIDVRDAMAVAEQWEQSLKGKEEGYWDEEENEDKYDWDDSEDDWDDSEDDDDLEDDEDEDEDDEDERKEGVSGLKR